ncbi:MAG: hypothetical protein M1840_001800 [Geoglossum simile]|nr:MAG: hypothetical protein M1840_001800 [Geoglossum simile]
MDLKGLVEYWKEQGVPDVLEDDGLLTKEGTTQLGVDWKAALSDSNPPRLSLSSSECKASAIVTFDIDSFIAHAHGLAVFKTGLRWTLDPFVMYNIQTNLHIRIKGRVLHKTRHILLGRCRTEENLLLYVVFPNMKRRTTREDGQEDGEEELDESEYDNNIATEGPEREEYQMSWTTQYQRALFTDQLLLPAIREICPASIYNQYPFSYRHGRDRTLARSHDSRNKEQVRQQAVSQIIPGEYLEEIWALMVRQTQRPTLACFRGMFLVVNSKNTKQHFLDDIAMHIDITKLDTDQTWLDIGQEVTPNTGNPKTFLWQMCCLDKWYRSFCQSLVSDELHKAHSMQYRCHLLENAGTITVELGGGNPLRKGGIVYAQRYNPLHRVFDAQGKVLFTKKAIEGFLVSRHHADLWRAAGGGSGTWTAGICKEIYLTSKSRVQYALEDTIAGLFGIRDEYRIQWDLFTELKPMVISIDSSKRSSCPYWRLSTSDVLEFVKWELNRWLACLKWLRVQQFDRQLADGHIVMGTILARLVKASINNEPIHIDYNLWKDSWTTQKGLYREGLDMQGSMKRYGLVWLPARKFDWQKLCPVEEFRDNCTFQFNAVQNSYQKRREAVAEVDEIYHDVQLIAASLVDADPPRTRELPN